MATTNDKTSATQLCFGEVRHARVRPVANAFAYRIYFLRLPLRTLSKQSTQQSSQTRWFSHNRFNLLSFHDRDHGDGKMPLTDWADALLTSQGIHDADGEIWLQTFPRVLGYVFNPVSFWFFHRKDGSLRAILCAVHNTFGEKHDYLLDTGDAMPYGIELQATKVFHVSPFFPIKGDYRFRFMRSFADGTNEERTVARIDYGDDEGLLLKTSISGESTTLTDASVARAFLLFPLMTLGVVVKIHWQALRLWIKRIPFFSKPEPPAHRVSK